MIYVDTSVIVTLLTAEPKTPQATAWFAALRETPICADWLLTEFASAISIKLRTGQLSEANAKRARKEFDVLTDGGLPRSAAAHSARRRNWSSRTSTGSAPGVRCTLPRHWNWAQATWPPWTARWRKTPSVKGCNGLASNRRLKRHRFFHLPHRTPT